MKNMKSILILAIFVLSSVTIAQNQYRGNRGNPGPPPVPNTTQINDMIEQLESTLSLSSSQKETLQNLYIKHFEEVNQKVSGNRPPKREEMENLNSDFETKVKRILTKEQFEKYKIWLDKQRERIGRR